MTEKKTSDLTLNQALQGFLLIVGGFFTIVGIVVGLALFRGLVLSLVWNWTLPKFLDVPQITIAQALAISILVGLFKGTPKKKEGFFKVVVNDMVSSTLTLLMAYIVSQYL